jgi:hypothetical protein|tara:strand:- start:11 stop:184 length:174 start_codon:yes stop_codon:yes gene_type:complete
MKQKLETMEEFIKRGGKVKQLPEEKVWDIIPLEEKIKFRSAVETLDYERDYKPKWWN